MLLRLFISALAVCMVAFADDCKVCHKMLTGNINSDALEILTEESVKKNINNHCVQEEVTLDCTQEHPSFEVHTCCISIAISQENVPFQDKIALELVALGSVGQACDQIGCNGDIICPDISRTPTLEAFLQGFVNEDELEQDAQNVDVNHASEDTSKSGSRFLQLSQKLRKHQKKGLLARVAHSSTAAQATGQLVTSWLEARGPCLKKESKFHDDGGVALRKAEQRKQERQMQRIQYRDEKESKLAPGYRRK